MYRFEAASIEGFVQQLAAAYLPHGYYFYVTGWIPEGKPAARIDQKLLERYAIGGSKWMRARRKAAGQANLQYLRHERFFVLLATHGQHPFFEQEAPQIRDVRRVPLKFAGYSISVRGGHSHVRIEQRQYHELKAYFLDLALHRSPGKLARALYALPFEPYAPVRRQLLNLLRAINRVRKQAGFAPIDSSCLRMKRHIYRPFEPPASPQKLQLMISSTAAIIPVRREAEAGNAGKRPAEE
jgi:hypothetical protein